MSAPSTPPVDAQPRTIDLNADLGEGFGRWSLGDDDALLELVTSANVACGFHAGDPTIMRRVCGRARERGVTIGAQVSYRDLAGFGRRPMVVPPLELVDEIVYQIGGLDACARAEGTAVRYVKPHGALNNVSVTDVESAWAIAEAVRVVDPTLPVLVQPDSELERQVLAAGLRGVREAYPDRAYEPGGRLRSRREPDAVLHDVATITARAVEVAVHGRLAAHDGTPVALVAASLCVHGDNVESVAAARSIRAALAEHGIGLRAFVEAG
jgi:5-oxoprolinase (ATP-hydrolysing) subunit A